METNNNPQVAVEAQNEAVDAKSVKAIVNRFMAMKDAVGNPIHAFHKGIKIKSAKVAVIENYTRVSLTIDREINGYVADPEHPGAYIKGKTNVIFTSLYSIVGELKNDDEIAFISNHLLENQDAIVPVLAGATCDVLQIAVAAGEEYVNPFSSTARPTTFPEDHILDHVVNINVGKIGAKAVEKIMDKMLGL